MKLKSCCSLPLRNRRCNTESFHEVTCDVCCRLETEVYLAEEMITETAELQRGTTVLVFVMIAPTLHFHRICGESLMHC